MFPADGEVLSAEEKASLFRVALAETSGMARSVAISVGSRYTGAVRTSNDNVDAFRIIGHEPVTRVVSQAAAARATGTAAARVLRVAADQIAEQAQLESLVVVGCPVVATVGSARTIVMFASGGGRRATLDQVRDATDALVLRWVEGTRNGRPHDWIEPLMTGSAVMTAMLERMGVAEIVVPTGALPDKRAGRSGVS